MLEDGNMLAADPTYGRGRSEGERERGRDSDHKQWQRRKMNHDSSNRDSCAALLSSPLLVLPASLSPQSITWKAKCQRVSCNNKVRSGNPVPSKPYCSFNQPTKWSVFVGILKRSNQIDMVQLEFVLGIIKS